MTNNYPDYLKLHIEEQSAAEEAGREHPALYGLDGMCRAFETTTGWKLEYDEQPGDADSGCWSMSLGEATRDGGRLALSPDSVRDDAMPMDRVRPLAQAVGGLVNELMVAHSAVRQREAELAAGIPVTLQPEDRRALADRLESVLQGGAEAIGCTAAALYLLDDATSYLKLRAAWQLPKSRFWDEPRPLRGSVADLEALVGHAVAIEDSALLPHWKVPEDFPAALCVPVATNSTPLGTLWFFADSVRDFTDEQIHIVEIVAGRLVADLEREVLVREGLRQRQSDVTHQTLVNWQDALRPTVPPLVDGWQVAGCSGEEDVVADQFYDWCILPDGRIAVAIGHAEGGAVEAGLTMTMLQIAMRSHAHHPHEARQMLDLLNEALWTHSAGDRFASLFYAMVDPDTGEMQYASSGETHALVLDPVSVETLTDGNPTLGFDPDHRFRQSRRAIEEGQSLVVFSRGNVTPLDEEIREPDECRVAELLQGWEGATAEEQAKAVIQEIGTNAAMQQRAVLVMRRLF